MPLQHLHVCQRESAVCILAQGWIPRATWPEGSCSSRREFILCCCFFLFLADWQWKFFQCSCKWNVLNSVGRERNQLRASSDPALAGLGNAKAASALLSKHAWLVLALWNEAVGQGAAADVGMSTVPAGCRAGCVCPARQQRAPDSFCSSHRHLVALERAGLQLLHQNERIFTCSGYIFQEL